MGGIDWSLFVCACVRQRGGGGVRPGLGWRGHERCGGGGCIVDHCYLSSGKGVGGLGKVGMFVEGMQEINGGGIECALHDVEF